MNEIVEIILIGILTVIGCFYLSNKAIGLVSKELFDSFI